MPDIEKGSMSNELDILRGWWVIDMEATITALKKQERHCDQYMINAVSNDLEYTAREFQDGYMRVIHLDEEYLEELLSCEFDGKIFRISSKVKGSDSDPEIWDISYRDDKIHLFDFLAA